MKNLIVHECESISINEDNINSLTESEAEELNRYIQSNSLDTTNIIWNRHQLKFINYVGFIQLTSCSIEILPKVSTLPDIQCRKVLVNMLAKSGYFDIDYSSLSSLQNINANLLEIFGYLFAVNLKRELIKGIYTNYNYKEENLRVLRGRILINRHIQNVVNNNSSQVYCGYEEFSINNLLNLVFKTATKTLIRFIKNTKTLETLKFCLLNLVDIDESNINIDDINKIQFNRINQRFYPSFLLAKMFLQSYTSMTTIGSNKSFSILFKMNDLFEKYVSLIALKNLPYEIHLQHQEHRLLINEQNGKGVFMLKPDILLSKSGTPQIIIDTKWKVIEDTYIRHGVSREDLYQMYAYLTKYQTVSTVILLYPHNLNVIDSGICLESWCLEEQLQRKIRVYTINYENDSTTIEDLIKIVDSNVV